MIAHTFSIDGFGLSARRVAIGEAWKEWFMTKVEQNCDFLPRKGLRALAKGAIAERGAEAVIPLRRNAKP